MNKYLFMLLFTPMMTLANESFIPHWFVNGSVGYGLFEIGDTSYSDTSYSTTKDDSDFTFELSVGYKFSENLGMSVGYRDLGSYLHTESRHDSGVDYSNESMFMTANDFSAFFISLDGYYPFFDKWTLLGKVGFNMIDVEYQSTHTHISDINSYITNSTHRSNTSEPFFTLGIEREITQDIGISLSYFNHSGINVQEMKVGLSYAF